MWIVCFWSEIPNRVMETCYHRSIDNWWRLLYKLHLHLDGMGRYITTRSSKSAFEYFLFSFLLRKINFHNLQNMHNFAIVNDSRRWGVLAIYLSSHLCYKDLVNEIWSAVRWIFSFFSFSKVWNCIIATEILCNSGRQAISVSEIAWSISIHVITS